MAISFCFSGMGGWCAWDSAFAERDEHKTWGNEVYNREEVLNGLKVWGLSSSLERFLKFA